MASEPFFHTLDPHAAACRRRDAGNGHRKLVAAGIGKTGDTDDLAFPDFQVHVLEARCTAKVMCAEELRNSGAPSPVSLGVDQPPGHQFSKLRLRVLLDLSLGYALTVPEDDCMPADPVAFVEFVRDEQHGHVFGTQALNDLDKIVDLPARQRGGGLIHDHQFGTGGDRPRNRDKLARGKRQIGYDRPHECAVCRQADRLESRGSRLSQPRLVEKTGQPAATVDQLLAEGNVFGDCKIWQQGKVLIDRLDPGAERLDGGQGVERPSVENNLAFVRR